MQNGEIGFAYATRRQMHAHLGFENDSHPSFFGLGDAFSAYPN